MRAFAYILDCADGAYCYGSTTDLGRRLRQHQDGKVPSTLPRRPVRLVYYEEFETAVQARQREHSLKNGRTRRKAINLLIAGFPPEHLAPLPERRVKGQWRRLSSVVAAAS